MSYVVDSGLIFVATADFNNDTKSHLAAIDGGSTSYVILDNGNGTFQKDKIYDITDISESITVDDFNNDNKVDIVISNNYDTSISILFGNGDRTFGNHIMSTTGSHPSFMVVGDFNKDTKLDVAVTNDQDNSVGILLNSCP
jgi:hypothetical protein